MSENSASVVPVAEVNVTPPAPGAEDQKPIPPEGEAPPETQQETTEQQEAKRQSKFQRRLDRQKTARIEAEVRARIAEERVAKLEAQSKPQGDQEPKREAFDSYEEYLDARQDHRDAKRDAERQAKQTEAQAGSEKQAQAAAGTEKVAKAWAERETTFEAATKDYKEVVGEFIDAGMQGFSREARAAIVESEVGPALLYHLAQNPEVADKIAELSPARQSAELGKLEATLPKQARTTNAPPPAKPVGARQTGGKDPEKMSQSEYEAFRKSQGARYG